ncbi:BglG family transcription antiterminator [Clostridium thermopalmarium]|uniref:Transcriptional regulator MtlR n=1 Tax=Clostridium thermopalmarium DSM 5974 TaxID=1121340 RepID=A0A2T0AMS7_9CLOT|nr:BglG family transcription antiterminator [Clostridium thermopalmarium]PRR70114.1 Transcriptional regulator MtlR [Clostridium thermopalmarium DSM 5974]PVZ23129.1 mannitol operon transcriptional antiterminator [Clostridium thermopalmarium DSM 5974]
MNNLAPRQQFILSKILNEGPLNIKDLHKQLNISDRTILREIASINKVLKRHSVHIFSDENMNLTISGNRESIEEIKISLESVPIQWLFSKEQRQIIIACELIMSKEALKASYFSHKFNVVMGSISLDLDSIEKWLTTKNLCLIRKRAYGVIIKGSEWNKRNALVDLIFEFKPFEELLEFLYDKKIDQTVAAFFNIVFGVEEITLVKSILKEVSNNLFQLNDIKYFKLFIHILLAIKKTENGDNIVLPEKIKNEVMVLEEYKQIQYLNEVLIKNQINLPNDELVYLWLNLTDYKYFSGKERTSHIELDINYDDIAKELIEEVSNKININIAADHELIRGLSQHFRQTIHMLSLGLKVVNPLISEIRNHYPELFKIINNACKLIFSRYNLKIPPEEVGYITMHIDVAIQRHQAILRKLNVLIVCPGGVGTSRILSNKVKAIFPDIGNVSIGSLHDISSNIDCEKYDLILSTVPINQEDRFHNVLEVSPFMSKDDIEKVNNFIFNFKTNTKNVFIDESSIIDSQGIENTEYEIVDDMLKNFRLKKTKASSIEELINFIVDDIGEAKLTSNKDIIKKLILKREEKGNVVIPGTGVALLHTRSDEMVIPFIGVYRIDEPLCMGSIGFTTEDVDTFLVMIARENESNYILKVLGKVSISLIEKKDFINLLKLSNIADIRNYLIETVNNKEEY